jgi:hypothetical protein
MCKKLCIAVGAVIVGLLAVTFVPKVGHKVGNVWDSVTHWANDVPPEAQLQQLHKEMDKIDKDIRHHVDKLAVMAQEVDNLRERNVAMKEKLDKKKVELTAMTKALDSTSEEVVYDHRKYKQAEMVRTLQLATSSYEAQKKEYQAQEKLLAQKTETYEISKERVKAMRQQKEDLQVAVAELEARLATLKTKQVDKAIDVDDSQVNKCNVLLSQAKKSIELQEKTAELYDEFGITKSTKEPAKEARPEKTKADVLDAAKKALEDEDSKVVDQK